MFTLHYVTYVMLFFFTENLGVYLAKNKMQPEMIEVHDSLSGKVKTVDVNILAAS